MQKKNSELTQLATSIKGALDKEEVQESLTNVFKKLQEYYINNELNMQGNIKCETKQPDFKAIIDMLAQNDEDQTKIGFLADFLFEMNPHMVAARRPQGKELDDIVTLLTKRLKKTKSIAMGVPKKHEAFKLSPNEGDNPIENDIAEENIEDRGSKKLSYYDFIKKYAPQNQNQKKDDIRFVRLIQLLNEFNDDILKREDIKKDLLQIFKDIQEYCKEKKINVHGTEVDAPLVLDEKYDVASIINSLKKEQTKKQQVSLLLNNLFKIDTSKTRNLNINDQMLNMIMDSLIEELDFILLTEKINNKEAEEKPVEIKQPVEKPVEIKQPVEKPVEIKQPVEKPVGKPEKRGGCFPFCGRGKVQSVAPMNTNTVNNAKGKDLQQGGN